LNASSSSTNLRPCIHEKKVRLYVPWYTSVCIMSVGPRPLYVQIKIALYESETMNSRIKVKTHAPWNTSNIDLSSSTVSRLSSSYAGSTIYEPWICKKSVNAAWHKNEQNARCIKSHSRFQVPKFIFLDMQPTPNNRQIPYLETLFFLSQSDRWNFEQFDFKVPFATDPRWSIWAGSCPCIRITWRDKQLFK